MKAKPTSSKRKPAERPKKTRRLRALSDELGVTTPKTARRSSAGVKQAPRSRPRKIR